MLWKTMDRILEIQISKIKTDLRFKILPKNAELRRLLFSLSVKLPIWILIFPIGAKIQVTNPTNTNLARQQAVVRVLGCLSLTQENWVEILALCFSLTQP